MKAYISFPDKYTVDLFKNNGFEVLSAEVGADLSEADLVVFTGGADVSPHYYGEVPSPELGQIDPARDCIESLLFDACKTKEIPMVGICRGAQFLCVMNGGKLKQHDESGYHLNSHKITVKEPERYDNSSLISLMASAGHHQIMIPSGLYNILGWDARGEKMEEADPEIVYWPETKCLGHQPHPEWMSSNTLFVKYFFKTITDLLLSEEK